MKKHILQIVVLVCCAMTLCVQAQTNEPAPAKPSYQEMLAKVKKGDSVDFKVMRFAFADTDGAYRDLELLKKMNKAFADKDFKEALRIAKEQLEKSYINIEAHRVVAYLSLQTNKTESDFHANIARGLLRSIISDGDGKTAKTAWPVVDVGEEYAVLTSLGYQVTNQSLIQEDGHSYDLMEAVNSETKEPVKFYFNIDKVFEGYKKMFKN